MSKSNYGLVILFYALVNILVLLSAREIYLNNKLLLTDIFNNIGVFSLVVLISFFLTIILHEFGHFIIGIFLDFKLIEIDIWIISFRVKNDKKLEFKIKFNRLLSFNGYTFMSPTNTEKFLLKQLLFESGGLILNFITFVSIILLLDSNIIIDYALKEYLLILAYISIIVAFINSLPLDSGDLLFDGRKIYNLITNKSFKNCLLIDSLNIMGIRPKDWLIHDYFTLNKRNYLENYDLILKYYELLACMDSNDSESSRHVITELLKNVHNAPIQLHDTILLTCSLFYSFVDLQPNYVKECIGALKHKFNPPVFTRSYIEVIQSQLNNDLRGLENHVNNFLELLKKSPYRGTRKFYSDILLSR